MLHIWSDLLGRSMCQSVPQEAEALRNQSFNLVVISSRTPNRLAIPPGLGVLPAGSELDNVSLSFLFFSAKQSWFNLLDLHGMAVD